MKRLIVICLLFIFIAGCGSFGVVMLGGACYEAECPVINPRTGDVALLPDGKAALAKYKVCTGRNSSGVEASAVGCFGFEAEELQEGTNRLESLTKPLIDVIEKIPVGG